MNKNFGRLDENGNVEYAPVPLIIDGKKVWTNIPEKYLECGFYPIVRTEMPEKEGSYFASVWAFENGKIVQKWEEISVTEEI